MNLFKSFDSILGQYMRKAARPLGSMESSNPHRWRGKRLHHHGGDVCCVFVLLWMDSWRDKLNVCKKWYKNNLKMRLMMLQSVPPRLAPHRPQFVPNSYVCRNYIPKWNNMFVGFAQLMANMLITICAQLSNAFGDSPNAVFQQILVISSHF